MECAAVPLPHPRLGEVVGLVVVLKPGHIVRPEELVESVSGKLAKFKIPEMKFVYFSSSPLVRGATDKINKLAIKQLLKSKL